MPIKIDDNLPAKRTLESENIFFMSEDRAESQDIRPLKIILLNLMPKKIETETQMLRLLGNSPLQLEIDFLQLSSHKAKNTSADHLIKFYKVFDEVKNQRYDGMIVTGAPVEKLAFEDVDYYKELCDIFDWARKNVYSSFFICWGAQAALHYYYGLKKYELPKKMFGIFEHRTLIPNHNLMRGFDDIFFAPHSRHTEIREKDIRDAGLDVLAVSQDAGVYIAADHDCREFFVMGHSEYDPGTLAAEYFRDKNRGLPIDLPINYFPNDDESRLPPWKWRAHANLMFSNWLNYFVYQRTPFDLSELNL